jgi:hypothetical protein
MLKHICKYDMDWHVIVCIGKVSIIEVQVNYRAISHIERVYCMLSNNLTSYTNTQESEVC